MPKNFAVYSFADTKVVINHEDVGQKILSDGGNGKITIARTGDMSSHTQTANGYTVVNRLKNDAGTVTIEVAQNSDADQFMQSLISYLKICNSDRFALTTITLNDIAAGKVIQADGATPQKIPDRTYDTTAGMISYAFLSADIQDK